MTDINPKRIEFEESFENRDGIVFTYREPCREGDGSYHEVHDKIPSWIKEEGKEAILDYALAQVKKAKEKWKKYEDFEDSIKRDNIPIKTSYGEVSLEGRIVEAKTRFIRVELDKPVKGGQRQINFGFASAMGGHYVFGKDYTISEAGYDAAYRALCWAYEDALHKPQKDLVKRLNQRLR